MARTSKKPVRGVGSGIHSWGVSNGAGNRHNNDSPFAMNYSTDYDTVLLAYSVLKRLGSGKIKTFEDRLRSQKTQYLAQLFNVSPRYAYSLYLRGPYSPTLTNDLFKLSTENVKADSDPFVPEALEENFQKLHTFLEGKSTRELELVTTLHLFLTRTTLTEKASTEKVAEMKNASKEEMANALSHYKELAKEV